jgi:hypothetical protein
LDDEKLEETFSSEVCGLLTGLSLDETPPHMVFVNFHELSKSCLSVNILMYLECFSELQQNPRGL